MEKIKIIQAALDFINAGMPEEIVWTALTNSKTPQDFVEIFTGILLKIQEQKEDYEGCAELLEAKNKLLNKS